MPIYACWAVKSYIYAVYTIQQGAEEHVGGFHRLYDGFGTHSK